MILGGIPFSTVYTEKSPLYFPTPTNASTLRICSSKLLPVCTREKKNPQNWNKTEQKWL